MALAVSAVPGIAAASPLSSATELAMFAGPKVTPDDAARKRAEAQLLGRDLAAADPAAAGMHYDTRASEWGDPILYLDAADAYLAAADKDGEIPMAEAGIERARIALDLLYFQLDAAADKDFRMVETGDIPTLIARANTTVDRGERLLEDLARRGDDPVADAKPAKEKRERKPIKTKPMFISGAVVTGLGGGVLGVGAVGLIIGAVNQSRAEDPTVYGTAYDDVEAKGERGNLIAGVGLGVGGALVLGGVAMMIIAKVAEKKQGKAAKEKNVAISPTLRGVSISGRF
jgi:hypothetical protein